MSDKITKTVTYEIEPGGDCGECKSLIKSVRYCMPFDVQLKSEIDWQYYSTYEQCQACQEFLSEQKSRVYCKGCRHKNNPNLSENFYCWQNENVLFENGKQYSLNCKNRSE